jgi:hypothetical protein
VAIVKKAERVADIRRRSSRAIGAEAKLKGVGDYAKVISFFHCSV